MQDDEEASYKDSDRDESNDDYWYTSNEEKDKGSDDDDEAGEVPAEANYRVTMWSGQTHYDVVKEVAKFEHNMHLTKWPNKKWDLAWWDGPIPMSILSKMHPWQKCNHLPGIYNLAKKNMLGRHLMRMRKEFPQDYDFAPQTFMLPHDFKEFTELVGEKRNKTFIVKPEAMS